jgi:hypothetical protein
MLGRATSSYFSALRSTAPLLSLFHVCPCKMHLSDVVLHFHIAHKYVLHTLLPIIVETRSAFAA